jgi:hypothetical protein
MLHFIPTPAVPPRNIWERFLAWIERVRDADDADHLRRQPYLGRPRSEWTEEEIDHWDGYQW